MNEKTINRPMIELTRDVIKNYKEVLKEYEDRLLNREDDYIEEITELKFLKETIEKELKRLKEVQL